MALKFLEKIKDIDLTKTKESLSGIASSISNVVETAKSVECDEIEDIEKSATDLDAQSYISESKEVLQQKLIQYFEENGEKLKKWYSDNKMKEKIGGVAKKVGAVLIFPVLLLYNLFNSPKTSMQDKMFIILPLAYFIMPVDLIPDFMFGVGYSDDVLAIMTSIKKLSKAFTPDIIAQTKIHCKDIFGDIDNSVIENITRNIEESRD